ncbi:MAG: dienelactone hydrolase family protein [Acidimicrobiales bacterium]
MTEAEQRRRSTAYVVAPRSGSGPGVLVLHGWWGLTPFVRQFCDRLADEGFVALAPDLFDGRTAETPDSAEELLASLSVDRAADLVLSTPATLRGLPVTDDRPVGVVGLSMGASLAFWLATRAPEQIAATVGYYGTQDVDFEPVTSPLLGHFAEHDELVSDDDVVEMEAHLRLLGKDVEFHRYAGTGHWFVEDDRPAAYDASAAALAWDRTLSFLRRHLDLD